MCHREELFDFNHVHLLPHAKHKHTHITKSPTIELSQRNAKCFPFDELLFPPLHTLIFCFIVLIPLKTHWNSIASFLPVTLSFPQSTWTIRHNEAYLRTSATMTDVKYFTWLMPHSWVQSVKVVTGLIDRLMANFFPSASLSFSMASFTQMSGSDLWLCCLHLALIWKGLFSG